MCGISCGPAAPGALSLACLAGWLAAKCRLSVSRLGPLQEGNYVVVDFCSSPMSSWILHVGGYFGPAGVLSLRPQTGSEFESTRVRIAPGQEFLAQKPHSIGRKSRTSLYWEGVSHTQQEGNNPRITADVHLVQPLFIRVLPSAC